MAVVSILDRVTAWAQAAICSKIMLKVPPSDELAPTDADYEWKLSHPTAFPLFVPSKDKLPPGVHSPFPSVCVRLVDGTDNISEGSIKLELVFSAWNPGVHGEGLVIPSKDVALTAQRPAREEADAYFRRSADGWRDAWNMVDIALREIESVTNIDDLVVDRSVPIKFGPLTEQDSIPDFYPFWFAWVSFAVRYPIRRNIRDDVTDFL